MTRLKPAPAVRAAILLAVLVPFVPSGAASDLPVYTVSSIEASGAAGLSGRLAGLEVNFPDEPETNEEEADEPKRPGANLRITQAAEIIVEIDHGWSNVSTVVSEGSPNGTVREACQTALPEECIYGMQRGEEVPFNAATLETTAVRWQADLFIAPLGDTKPEVVVTSKVLCVLPHSNARLTQYPRVTARDPMVVEDIEDSQHIVEEQGGTVASRHVTVTGDFVFSVWEWDFSVRSEDNNGDFQTGKKIRPIVQNPNSDEGDPLVWSSNSRQAYVTVTGGILELEITDGTWNEGLYVEVDKVGVDGRLLLKDAVLLGTSSEPADIDFKGFLLTKIEPSSDSMEVQFLETSEKATPKPNPAIPTFPTTGETGKPDASSGENSGDASGGLDLGTVRDPLEGASGDSKVGNSGGKADPASAVVTDRLMESPLPWFLLLLALGLAALVPPTARGLRMARLRRAMDGRDYSLVAQKAPRMLRTKRHAKEAAVMVAVSKLKLGDREGAKQFLDKLPWDQKPDPATGSYLLACIRALEGDWDTAARLLAECVSANPSMGPQIASNPWFRPLLAHPTLGEALRPTTTPREGYA